MSIPMRVVLVVLGVCWEGEGVKEMQRRCLQCDPLSPAVQLARDFSAEELCSFSRVRR